MSRKLSIKYLVLFFASLFLYNFIAGFSSKKLSCRCESSIDYKVGNYKLNQLSNQSLQDSFDYFDDENDSEYKAKVKNNHFFNNPSLISKSFSFLLIHNSFSPFNGLKWFTKKIFLIISVFRL